MGLQDELRGLPPSAWGVVAGVAALGGLWWYRKHEADSAGAVSTTTTPTTGVETDVSGLTDAQILSAESGGGDAGTAYSNNSSASTNITSNSLWEAQGVGYATSIGYSPITAQSSLEAYMNGLTLDSQAQLIVNAVITKYGLPPEGTQGTSPTKTTAPPGLATLPTPKPTSTTVKTGSTFGFHNIPTVKNRISNV